MAFLFRWLMRGFLALAALAAAGLGLAYYLAGQSLPDYDRTLTLAGPEREIEIVRDRYAVPHVLAATDHDAFFGLGFVHAQDRLWQMTLARRTAQGRLSEIFGAETVAIDTADARARPLRPGARRRPTGRTRRRPPRSRPMPTGSTPGCGWCSSEALGRGAPEFFLFTQEIAPWLPADSIAVQKLMALQMTDKAALETLRASLSLRLPPERLNDILPLSPNAPLMGLPEFSELFPGAAGAAAGRGGAAPARPAAASRGCAGASNAFAATGARAAAGKPLLATDPHLGAERAVDLDAGAARPRERAGDRRHDPRHPGGAGRPQRRARLGPDLELPRRPGRLHRAARPRRSRPLPDAARLPAVRDARDDDRRQGRRAGRRSTLRWSRHGPVIPGDDFGAAAITPPGHVAALAWTGLSADDRSVGAAIALMRAALDRRGAGGDRATTWRRR